MKTNKLKLVSILSTLVVLMYVTSTPVKANGAYGTGVVLAVVDDQVHETVDAGIEDLVPQVAVAFTAIFGFVTTSVLIKKTK